MHLSMTFEIASLEVAPTIRSSSLPPLKRIMVGMLLIPYCPETCGLSSTFSFTMVALPAYFSATATSVGARARHGPHHSAQKSTSTGVLDSNTSFARTVANFSHMITHQKSLL